MVVKVIGAGLAGCEASLQLAKYGYDVELYDIKPLKFSPAHTNPNFCVLLCSNSLKSNSLQFATGLLKQELREMGSEVLKLADECRISSNDTLTVDREKFSAGVTEKIKTTPQIKVVNQEVLDIPSGPVIIATGPLTTDGFASTLQSRFGNSLYFYDAVAPIIDSTSIDMTKVFFANKFGENAESEDYLNCPLDKETYYNFCNELTNAKRVPLKSFEQEKVFEGCMPIEVMAHRDIDTLRHGPLKANWIKTPSGNTPFACVQLRKENAIGDAYNMVGFQTNLTFPEQKRVFSLIPGLENCEFLRYGVMHRNIFINAPKLLNKFFQLKQDPWIFFAGQISGVEGYVESIASGLLSAINMVSYLKGEKFVDFGTKTALGALSNYLECANENNFQPMHINWGLIAPIDVPKQQKKEALVNRAMIELCKIKETLKWKC